MEEKEVKKLIDINEEGLEILVKEIIEKSQNKIKKEDAEEIVNNIMPHLDSLVAKRVKQHFKELFDFIKEKFKGE